MDRIGPLKGPLEKIKKVIKKIQHLRPRKMHLDYVAGLLSIPVLITAIIINFSNLHKTTPPSPTVTPTPQVIVVPQNSSAQNPTVAPTSLTCQKSIGPITISYPNEGQTIVDNPVCITINYSDPTYCPVTWSYSINNGSWSDYNTNAPCLYNLPNGNVVFQLQVQSSSSSDKETLTRNFVYAGANNPVATPTMIPPTATIAPTATPVVSPTTIPPTATPVVSNSPN